MEFDPFAATPGYGPTGRELVQNVSDIATKLIRAKVLTSSAGAMQTDVAFNLLAKITGSMTFTLRYERRRPRQQDTLYKI